MSEVAPLFRTLDQELSALARGASLECLVCGEFVMQVLGGLRCRGVRVDARRGAGRLGGAAGVRTAGRLNKAPATCVVMGGDGHR